MDFIDAFQHALAETIAWCAPRATPLEPEECVEWLANRDTDFTRALQETGLLA